MLFQAQNSALGSGKSVYQTLANILITQLFTSAGLESGLSITRSGYVKPELQRFLGICPDPTGSATPHRKRAYFRAS